LSVDVANELARLLAPGVLGYFTHYEVTEVFAKDESGQPFNVLTIVVLEERNDQEVQKLRFLNKERIKVANLQNWSFGVCRYSKVVSNLLPAIKSLCTDSSWKESGNYLQMGKLDSMCSVFVPPDATTSSPLNRVLRNNLWNGSYVFEWFDSEKSALATLLDSPKYLKDLSEQVNRYVPIGLASLSDRLGDLLVQIPVRILMSEFGRLQNNGHYLNVAWHPKATPRALRFNGEIRSDKTCRGYVSSVVQLPQTVLNIPHSKGMSRGVIWDDENQLILADTGELSFIDSMHINTHISDTEPRLFTTPDKENGVYQHRVSLVNHQMIKSIIGESEGKVPDDWMRQRIYEEELTTLTKERKFLQYKPTEHSDQASGHQEALDDVRALINRYGVNGAWLWDPYLSASDILQTLFYCSFSGVELRALTGAKEVPVDSKVCKVLNIINKLLPLKKSNPSYLNKQRNVLEASKGNTRGLVIEYRMNKGPEGWRFHDRFLIFPKSDERAALVWSLGTSVNSLGKEHHILQRVDNGQLVVDAFEELWEQLDKSEHLIWKTP